MHAFVKFSCVSQINVFGSFSGSKTCLPIPARLEARDYDEISICWSSARTKRPIGKTKKFYNSRAIACYGDTNLGKAYVYLNRLLTGKWVDVEEYELLWDALLKIERSEQFMASRAGAYLESEARRRLCRLNSTSASQA